MLHPTSRVQFAAASRGDLPDPELLSEGIWSFAMPMGSGGPPYNLCYVIQDTFGDLLVIDPGTESDENWELLQENLRGIGKSASDVQTIVATHLHRDHLGLAGRLRAASGGQLVMHREEVRATRSLSLSPCEEEIAQRAESWGVPAAHHGRLGRSDASSHRPPSPAADVLCEDGAVLPVPGRDLQVIHTPGHTSGHMCIRDLQERILFTGDHVLPTINSGIGLGGDTSANQVDVYLNSLAAIAEFDDHVAAPGHQYAFRNIKNRCDSIAVHQLRRTLEVRAALENTPHAPVWEVASGLGWSAGWENLSGHMLVSALAQTETHVDFLRLGLAERHLRAHNIN